MQHCPSLEVNSLLIRSEKILTMIYYTVTFLYMFYCQNVLNDISETDFCLRPHVNAY
jgi:hypothetical protein